MNGSIPYMPQIADWYRQVALPLVQNAVMANINGMMEFKVSTFMDRIFGPRVEIVLHTMSPLQDASLVAELMLRPDPQNRYPLLGFMRIIPEYEDISVEEIDAVKYKMRHRSAVRRPKRKHK